MATRVLIVEDDRDIADLVARYLSQAGFATEVIASGREALAAIAARPPDLLVLDLMLPQVDGLEICRAVRTNAKTNAIPIIMLTARAEESDRIVGLELGADDYIAKPFSPNELVARARALLRRAQRATLPKTAPISYGSIVVDPETHTVSSGDRAISLTAKEFLLLEYLLLHRGRVLSRDVLLTDVWGYRYTGGTRTVDVHVRRLREKLPLLADALVTVKQFGYKLMDPAPLEPRTHDRRLRWRRRAFAPSCFWPRCRRRSIALVVAGLLFGESMRIRTDARLEQTLVAEARLAAELIAGSAVVTADSPPAVLDAQADRMGQLLDARVTLIAAGRPRGGRFGGECRGGRGDGEPRHAARGDRGEGSGRRAVPAAQRHAEDRHAVRRRRGAESGRWRSCAWRCR